MSSSQSKLLKTLAFRKASSPEVRFDYQSRSELPYGSVNVACPSRTLTYELDQKTSEVTVTHPNTFQLPTIFAPEIAPNSRSERRDSPRHMTMFPGGASLARAR